MHHYGPLLYGSYWDIAADDLADYQELAAQVRGRPVPAFVPPWQQLHLVRKGLAGARGGR